MEKDIKKFHQLEYTYEKAAEIIKLSLHGIRRILEENQTEGNIMMEACVPRMKTFLTRVGISMDDIDKLKIIHLTGTKGKGSTSFYCESILRNCGFRTGLFTSPHVIELRERIRINGKPISKNRFASCFEPIYKLLRNQRQSEKDMPSAFGLLFIMAITIFLEEKLDIAVIEVGIGGEFDSTNIFRHPVACGVTNIGLDHTELLGETVQEIAWHKGGIFKSGAAAITVNQRNEVLTVLQLRAAEVGVVLSIAPSLDVFVSKGKEIELQLVGDVQRINAGLALQLCNIFLNEANGVHNVFSDLLPAQANIRTIESFPLTEKMLKGLVTCTRLGVNQTIKLPGITYYLDGAHTLESMQQCVDWFNCMATKEAELLGGKAVRILLFHTIRDPKTLLNLAIKCKFEVAAFCPTKMLPKDDPADFSQTPYQREKGLINVQNAVDAWNMLSREGLQKPNLKETNADSNEKFRFSTNRFVCKQFQEFVRRHQLQLGQESSLLETTDYESSNVRDFLSDNPRTSIIKTFDCMQQAMTWIQQAKNNKELPLTDNDLIQVLVTGGVPLVGCALFLLKKE